MSTPNVLESLGDLDRLAFAFELLSDLEFTPAERCPHCHVPKLEHDRCKLTEWLDEVYVLLDAATHAGQVEPEPTSDEVWEPLPVSVEGGGVSSGSYGAGTFPIIETPSSSGGSADDFTEIVELRGGNRNGGLVRVTPGARELVDDGRYVITDERNVAGRRIARPRGRFAK